MKWIIRVIVMLVYLGATAQDKNPEAIKAENAYKRLMESAHPTPAQKPQRISGVPLTNEAKNPIFLNVNTITTETGNYKMQNESSIAVNPLNPEILIASSVDYREDSSTWIYVSTDGGKTWENKNLGHPYAGWRSTNDPSVAFDMDGTGYLVYGGFGVNQPQYEVTVGENGVFMARSTDEGETWEAHIPVIVHRGEQTLDSTFEDKYYITIDNSSDSPYFGHIYIPWKRVTPRDSATQIVISKSSDKGDSWSTPLPVSHRVAGSSEDTTFGQSFPLVGCGPNGEVYLVWHHGIEHAIGFAKSENGSQTFTEPELIHTYERFGQTIHIPDQGYRHGVKNKVRAECYPVIATDITDSPNRGNIYLCWAQDNPPNIYFMKSDDEGESWSDPVIVQSDTTNDQFWPWMSVDPTTGDLAIMYLDSRNDPENILVDCYVSYSSDGGDTWIDRRASDVAGDLRNNPFTANSFAGDYSGNAFYGGKIYPSWIDMRYADEDIFDSDVFTAVVNTRAPMPPENFRVGIDPDNPDQLLLGWDAPHEMAFGQSFDPAELGYELYRDDELVANPEGDMTEYTDKGLSPHELYKYKLYATLGENKSRPAFDSAYAGGSEKPAAPEIIYAKGSAAADEMATLEIMIPSKRKDGITPLANIREIRFYADSEFIAQSDLIQSDTGTVKKMTLPATQKTDGYYRLHAAIVARAEGFEEKQSDPSAARIIYTGEIKNQFADNFDSGELDKYYIAGDWRPTGNFFHSGGYSLTESPDGDYSGGENDTLIIFPVYKNADEKFELSFWHAAIIKTRDKGYVEYATSPEAQEWTVLAEFDEEFFQPWQNEQLDSEDWKLENYTFTSESDTVYVRFRFSANMFGNRDGWYIDDILLRAISTSVAESDASGGVLVYPNPASQHLTIRVEESISDLEIKFYNILGESINGHISLISSSINEHSFDISRLRPGVYIIEIRSKGKEKITRRIISITK